MSSERENLMAFLKGMFDSGKINVMKEDQPIPDEAVIVVTLAEDGFDPARDREVWKLEANRSAVRDVTCRKCGKQVIMSDGMFGRLVEGKIKPHQIVCGRCLL